MERLPTHATWTVAAVLTLRLLGILLYLLVVRPALRAQLKLVAAANARTGEVR